MKRIRIACVCAGLLPVPALAAETKAQSAAQDMMAMYEDLCLNQFPNLEKLGQSLAARHAVPLDPAETKKVLLGHAGTAWHVAGLEGSYEFGLEMPPSRRCVVAGVAAEDEGVRTVFEALIRSYAKAHEFGDLQAPPVQPGHVQGAAATLQILAAAPAGRSRQAFVNMGMVAADGTTQLRLTRELAPQ